MKDYLEDKYGLDDHPGYGKLRRYVLEAWNELPDDYLKELLASMPLRGQVVLDANESLRRRELGVVSHLAGLDSVSVT
ncbi:hypothetical protein P885DRAFT_76869 [Corynascus similis CBS 632.67]